MRRARQERGPRRSSRRGRGAAAWGTAALLAAGLAPRAGAVQFGPLTDLQTGIGYTSVLTLGPEDPDPGSNADGCIYAVHASEGSVHRVCFDANKSVTSNTVVIDINGAAGVNNVLGIAIDPDSDPAGEIHLYLGYSDDNSAPYQGKIARAVSTDGGASYSVDEDFITGLGRSSFDHQTNGLDFGPDKCLYIAQGNKSNAGYDTDFSESRLSSGLLRACFKAPGGGVDPAFDGNCGGGNSQQACDVEVYASGLRNPYDLVWHSNGRLYNADNDANQGFRDNCGAEANNFGCPCQVPPVEPIGDEINLIEKDKYYGSPNPYRANPSGLQCNGGTDGGDSCTTSADCGGGGSCVDLSSLCTDGVCGDISQCYYFGYNHGPAAGEDPNGIYRQPIAQISALLDGITEYRSRFDGRGSGSFCSDWNGDLVVAGGPGSVRRFSLSADGTSATHQGTGNLNGATGLDVVVGHDGTIYTADLNNGKVTYLEPIPQSNPLAADYFVPSCASGEVCTAGACEADGDDDGLGDSIDPCPADPLNRCAGPVATDGNTGNPIRINASTGADACAGTKVDCNGDTWLADFGYNQAASSFACDLPGGCPVNASGVFGCTDASTEDIFKCEHWDASDLPELRYSFDVPDGDYLVNLLFMNAYSGTTAVGDRSFDILIEDATVYSGFDQVAAAGGSGIPVVRSALVTVSDGNGLQIELGHQPPENPNLKGLEVLAVGVPQECSVNGDCDDSNPCTDDACNGGACSNTPNSDPCDDGVACTGGDQCSGGVCAGSDSCTGGQVCNAGSGLCETPSLAIRINVNGAQHAGVDFPGTWAADPGSGGVCGPNVYSNTNPINGTADDELFQGEVWGNPMTCQIDDGGSPLPAGDYTVNLYFAEIYHGPGCPGGGSGTGERVFDVSLEGSTVETGIDLFSEAGCAASTTDPNTGVVVRSYVVNVVDGVLDISMPASVDAAKISAIEVLLQSPGGGGCQSDAECDDADLCTADVCNAGTCENSFDPLVCLDGFPSSDDFEVDLGGWSNAAGDDLDWTRNSGPTQTNNTGPSGDHTTGSGFYLYTEASGSGSPNKTALLESSCIELSGMAQASWSFWYHMYGSAMGSLDAEVAPDCGTSWTSLWSESGDHGDVWLDANLDLAAYVGQRVRLRFRGVTGSSIQSDMAIDDVVVDASSTPPSTVPTDIRLPGTQPNELSNDLEQATNCSLCHRGYSGSNPMAEPNHGWGGSMMAHASRDPLFWGALAIAEQGFGGSGDLCLRCHVPKGWLAGRSEPTDGSALLASDADGVQCDLCHRLTNPDASEHLGVQNSPFIANDGGSPAQAFTGAGMYVLWDQGSKLGPYDDASSPHGFLQSNLHRSADACGTCHDVSNPLTGDLAPNNGAQFPLPPGRFSDVPGAPVTQKAAFLNFPHEYGVIERTYSEFRAGALSQMLVSDFGSLPADLQAGAILTAYESALLAGAGGNYADGTPRTFSCQACHMRATSGEGCSLSPPGRDDLPTHDLTGGNNWAPDAIAYLDGLGQLRLGGGLNSTQLAELDAGKLRAEQMLSDAAALELNGNTLKVINLTGHKLITGYPEGRRMWLDIQWLDAFGGVLDEVGAYGQITADIDGVPTPVQTILDPSDPDLRVYEVHNAITQEWASELLGMGAPASLPLGFDRETGAVTATLGGLAAQAPGTWIDTNHFILNNFTSSDTRIPPYGMTYDAAAQRNALPVPASQYGNPGAGGTYDYWDEVTLNPPPGAASANIRLLYQPTSWEYVQFLYLANDGSNAFLAEEGSRVLDAWLNTGMAQPYEMASTLWTAPAVCGDGSPDAGEACDDGAANGTTTCGCALDCSYPAAGTACDDATVCNGAESCDGAGTCAAGTPLVCDDGQFCNGAETCDAALGCQAGTPVDPSDGVACTDDSCDEVNDVVVNTPNDALCDDGQFCDGAETCDALLDCQAGTPPPLVEDGVSCTNAVCDEANDRIAQVPDDSLCDDGDVCDGAELCHPFLDCQPPVNPLNCDDGNACTADSCDAITGCANTPIVGCVATAVPAASRAGRALLLLLLALPGWALLRAGWGRS